MKYLYFKESKLFLVSSSKMETELTEIIVDDTFDAQKEINGEFGIMKVDKTLEEIQSSIDYITLRKVAYSQLNQFELQYNDTINNTTTWQDAINEIKAKYPKPE